MNKKFPLVIFLTSIAIIITIAGYSHFINQPQARAQTINTYYVSPTGTASWQNCVAPAKNGTEACSWQTAMANAAAGDVVYFRGGTYNVGNISGLARDLPPMRPANSGIAGNPINFIAYPNETPVITAIVSDPATTQSGYLGCYRNNYINWNGFSATLQRYGVGIASDSPGNIHRETHVFGVWESNYCNIKNSNFTGIDVGSGWAENTTFLYINQSNYTIIENNYFHDLIGGTNTTAAWVFQSTGTIIRNNMVVNSKAGFRGKTQPDKVSIYNNFIYSDNGSCTTGISLFFQPIINIQEVGGHNIYQNVIVGCSYGIRIVPISNTYTATISNASIYNNTIYHNVTGSGIETGDGSAGFLTNMSVYNNIIAVNVSGTGNVYNAANLRYHTANTTPGYSNYNDFYGSGTWAIGYATQNIKPLSSWRTALGCGTQDYCELNSIISNPLFVNAGGTTPESYKLQTTPIISPAINAGIDRQDYNNDGNATESINIGAYITGDEIIGYVAPSSPAPLKADFNSDSKVNNTDFLSLKNVFKNIVSALNAVFDLNSDSAIDVRDLGVLMSSWLP